ncbi:MAG: hypothetical protein AB1505_04990 [Candidatus Latescibacterota bacterium]
MGLVDPCSLAGTLANLDEALLSGQRLTAAARHEAAVWLAARVGQEGSYCGLPAPTEQDRAPGFRLFTGEPVTSQAGRGCKLGFEATWALTVLHPSAARLAQAAHACRQRVLERYSQEVVRSRGMYCCYSCSVAGWRALGVAEETWAQPLLDAGIGLLRARRLDNGRWDKFPYWYTLLSLCHLDTVAAREEMRHAAGALGKWLSGRHAETPVTGRRRLVGQRVLERV